MKNVASNFQLQLTALIKRLPQKPSKKIGEIFSDPTNYQTIGLWTSAFMAALISVVYAKLFHLAERGFHQILEVSPYAVLLLSPAFFVLAWLIVRKYSPEAAGSGIPQIMAANEIEYVGAHRAVVNRLLSLKAAVVKIISSLLCVLGGGAIGREGPTLQISTSVFHFFGQQVRRFTPHTGEHTWVVAGAAAGLASAFNTPLGGIVYAIEELGLVHFHKIRTALISGVIVSGLVAQWALGSYLYLGFPALKTVGFSMLPVAILNGAITGVLGAAFGRLLLFFLNKRLALKKTSHLTVLTILCGLIVASFSIVDTRSSGTGINVITGFLFQKDEPNLSLIALRYIGTMVSYLSGAAGGIFSPSLAIGATIGSYLAKFIATDHANLMILLGMIGFLTGVTRTPFTSFILVLEMTDRHSAIFPMMLTALSAQWFSHLIDRRSFYEHVKEKYLEKQPQRV
ncbi:MAG: chloride channel protein [Bdellovibrionales bacterium]